MILRNAAWIASERGINHDEESFAIVAGDSPPRPEDDLLIARDQAAAKTRLLLFVCSIGFMLSSFPLGADNPNGIKIDVR
jgi:hypothetical protein